MNLQFMKKLIRLCLPGDFIAMKFTGECTTTSSAFPKEFSGIFKTNDISEDIMNYFGFDGISFRHLLPLFSSHGYLKETVADRLSLTAGIPVSYKAGDQPNNALSLNVLKPGEVAATAGTSGVIYGVSDQLNYDQQSRINSFAHVNHKPDSKNELEYYYVLMEQEFSTAG